MGSTHLDITVLQACQDHPHIHGEHLYQGTEKGKLTGSPPYTWGALFFLWSTITAIRITPIYMGST